LVKGDRARQRTTVAPSRRVPPWAGASRQLFLLRRRGQPRRPHHLPDSPLRLNAGMASHDQEGRWQGEGSGRFARKAAPAGPGTEERKRRRSAWQVSPRPLLGTAAEEALPPSRPHPNRRPRPAPRLQSRVRRSPMGRSPVSEERGARPGRGPAPTKPPPASPQPANPPPATPAPATAPAKPK
jgi:hypothetical protein